MTAQEPSDVGPAVGGDLRVSDADREQVMNLLGAAYAEGRLTTPEHAERIDAAGAARTFDDLIPLTRDLVPLYPMTPATTPAPEHQLIDRSVQQEQPDYLIGILGGGSRNGAWRVRRQLKSYCLLGGYELDFTDAVFEDDVVVISGLWCFGGLTLKVPPGVWVRDETVGILGGTDVKRIEAGPGAPTIVLRGLCLFGGIEAKGPRRRRWRRR